MPIYCYTAKNLKKGNHGLSPTVEMHFPAGKAPRFVIVSAFRYDRDYQAEARGMILTVVGSESPCRGGPLGKKWPMEPCVASGVHANQAGELREYLKKNGCPTEVTADGDPVYTSARHQEKALKCRGMHNNSSFN